MGISQRRRSSQSGSTILEFALVAPFLVITLFGTVSIGIAMVRNIQALQICRDLAHMYADGVDFSQTANKNIAVQLASGTGMSVGGGNGVVIFSRISTIYQADCNGAGVPGCANLNQQVVTQRLVIGNSGLRSSSFATPNGAIIDAYGNISAANYMNNDSSVRCTATMGPLLGAAGMVQADGDASFVTEVYFLYPDLSFLGSTAPAGAYTRFMF